MDCSLQPKNINLPWLLQIGDDWASIPQHLILGLVTICFSLPLYWIFLWYEERNRKTKENSGSTPPLLSLVLGREDAWIMRRKGNEAFNYIHFQRMLFFLALIILVISTVSLFININGNDEDNDFNKTTITNLEDNSAWHWFNIIASFVLPWVVIRVVKQFMIAKDNNAFSLPEESNTLVVEGLDPTIFSNLVIEEYFNTNYPSFHLSKITRTIDTRYLRKQMLKLEWNMAIIEQLLTMGGSQEAKLTEFRSRKLEIKNIIEQEQRRLKNQADCLRIVFLTFESTKQAQKVVLMEKLDHLSHYCNIQHAPWPEDIAWDNVRSPVLSSLIHIFSSLFILLVAAFAASPAAFSDVMMKLMSDITRNWMTDVVPSVMFLLFGVTMPFVVKLSLVRFGHWSKNKLVSNYMTALFFWLLLSIVIFPTLMLINVFSVFELIFSLPFLKALFVDVSNENEDQDPYGCLYLPTTGAVFVNYLVLSALVRSQVQLHRLVDRLYQLGLVTVNCNTSAGRAVANNYAKEYVKRRNSGDNMSLAEDYVWCILHLAIMISFCLICPLVTPVFVIYIITKHLVDIQNLRVCYSARVDRPILMRTAAQLVIFCPLLGQICTTIVHLTNKEQKDNSFLFLVSGFLLILNLFLMMILQSTGWKFPVSVFGDETRQKQRQSWRRGTGRKAVYQDPVLNLDLGRLESD